MSSAQPASRSASSSARICAAAPTSTPQVGCATISAFGAASISRPMMNFWRLPPDRLRAAAPGPAARTPKRSISRRASAAAFAGATWPNRPTGSRRVSSVFCANDIAGTAPRPSRSSGTWCSPSARRRAGPIGPRSTVRGGAPPAARPRPSPAAGDGSSANQVTVPAGARRSSPDSTRSSSCWPLPDTPARPRISPRRNSSASPARAVPCGVSGARSRPLTRNRAAACSRTARAASRGGSAPIISRDRLALLSWRGSTSPVTRPARSTVQRWHSARISSSLWLM